MATTGFTGRPKSYPGSLVCSLLDGSLVHKLPHKLPSQAKSQMRLVCFPTLRSDYVENARRLAEDRLRGVKALIVLVGVV